MVGALVSSSMYWAVLGSVFTTPYSKLRVRFSNVTLKDHLFD